MSSIPLFIVGIIIGGLAIVGIITFVLHRDMTEHDRRKPKATEKLPDLNELERAWRIEIAAFAQAYVPRAQDVGDHADARHAGTCAAVLDGNDRFWYARDRQSGQPLNEDWVRSLREAIGYMALQRQRLEAGPGPSEDDRPAIVRHGLQDQVQRLNDITHRIGIAKGTVQSLQTSHPAQAPEAEAALATAIQQRDEATRLFTELVGLHDDDRVQWAKQDLRNALERANSQLSRPEQLLERAERARIETANQLKRYESLHAQAEFASSMYDPTRQTLDLLLLAKRRGREAKDALAATGPKDWIELERRLRHATNELRLIFGLLGQQPPSS